MNGLLGSNWLTGIICLWSGAIVDIPNGWALCDGNNGTPDLRDRFIMGAGGSKNPGQTGGTTTHSHAHYCSESVDVVQGYTEDAIDCLDDGYDVEAGDEYPYYSYCTYGHSHEIDLYTNGHAHTVTDNYKNHRPPYYALAYIMKL